MLYSMRTVNWLESSDNESLGAKEEPEEEGESKTCVASVAAATTIASARVQAAGNSSNDPSRTVKF